MKKKFGITLHATHVNISKHTSVKNFCQHEQEDLRVDIESVEGDKEMNITIPHMVTNKSVRSCKSGKSIQSKKKSYVSEEEPASILIIKKGIKSNKSFHDFKEQPQ